MRKYLFVFFIAILLFSCKTKFQIINTCWTMDSVITYDFNGKVYDNIRDTDSLLSTLPKKEGNLLLRLNETAKRNRKEKRAMIYHFYSNNIGGIEGTDAKFHYVLDKQKIIIDKTIYHVYFFSDTIIKSYNYFDGSKKIESDIWFKKVQCK